MANKVQYTLELLLGARKSAGFNKNISGAKNGIDSLSSVAKKSAALITGAFAAVNIGGAVKDAIATYADYQQELANSAAIAGATGAEYAKMEKASREAGKSTTKTAKESAQALGYMALAGWNVNQSTKSLMPVLKLSEATNMDLALTSDLVTDSMSALKLNVKDLPQYLDLVTKENNSANTSSEQLMQAFIKTGGAARTLQIGAKDTGIALGILANNGTKAEQGGRAMNAILTRIASNKEALGQMKALGVSVFDAKGKFVGLEEALKRINKGVADLSVEDKAKALKNIAGTDYYSKMAYLLDGVKKGAHGAESAWDKLDDQLSNSEGTLDEMDKKITNTASGALKRLESAADDARISFGDAFSGVYTDGLNELSGVLNGVSSSIGEFSSDNKVKLHLLFDDITSGIKSVLNVAGNVGSFVWKNSNFIISGIEGIGSAMATYKLVSGAYSLVDAFSKLASLSPIGKIGLVIGGITAVGAYIHKTKQKMVQDGLESHFGSISLSLEELDEISKQIVGKKRLTQISAMLDSIGKTDESIKSMQDSFSDYGKISWKLHAGFELDQDDKDTYASSLKNYVKSAQDAVANQGYSVSIATKLLLGDNSKQAKIDNKFYSGLDAELNQLKTTLNKRIKKAVKNGVDINTDESIQVLLKKINKITSAVTKAQNTAEFQSIQLKYSGKDLTADDFKQMSKDINQQVEESQKGLLEAYKTKMATLNAELEKGAISKPQFNKAQKEAITGYWKEYGDALSNGSKYLEQSILDAYPKLKNALSKFDGNVSGSLSKYLSGEIPQGQLGIRIKDAAMDSVNDTLSSSGISQNMLSQVQKIMEYGYSGIHSKMQMAAGNIKKDGGKIPKGLANGLNSSEGLSAITGSSDDMLNLMGKTVSGNPKLSSAIKEAQKNGEKLPKGLANGINSQAHVVKEASNNLIHQLEGHGSGQFYASISMNVGSSSVSNSSYPGNNHPITKKNNLKNTNVNQLVKNSGFPLHHNAKGGIYKTPILTTFAEEGAEAAIPLDGSNRAKTLWRNAGKILGMKPVEDKTMYPTLSEPSNRTYKDKELERAMQSRQQSNSGGGDVKIVYSPNIVIKGNADEKVLTKVMSMSQRKFNEMMDTYLHQHGRVTFSR